MPEVFYDSSMFDDGYIMPNSLVVFHLGQVYELLKSWDGKGALFFYLDLALSNYSNASYFKKQQTDGYLEYFASAGLLKNPSKKDYKLIESFQRILFALEEQNGLYHKLMQNILQQKKVSFKMTLQLSQYSSASRRICYVYKDGSRIELDKSIVDFINSLPEDSS